VKNALLTWNMPHFAHSEFISLVGS
jgi:hypothetical protein